MVFMEKIWFVIFSCAISYCIGQDGQTYEPVWEVDGDPHIIVLFDLHRTLLDNGTCSDLNPRVVERALSIKWLNNIVKNDGKKSGFSIYDTCGSTVRTLDIVTRRINPQRCFNASGIAGIISHTKKDTQDIISDFVEHLGILHVRLDDTSYIAKGINASFNVPTFSIWKIQAVIEILKDMKWNYISAYSDGTENTAGQLELFLKMANKHSVCVSNYARDLRNISFIKAKTKGTVIFTSEYQNVESYIGNLDHKFIIVSNTDIGSLSLNVSETVLHVAEKLNSRPALLAYLASELLQSEDPVTKTYLSLLNFCGYNSTLNTTVCSNELNGYLEFRTQRADVLAAITAYFNIHRIIQRIKSFNCTKFNYLTCPSAFTYVTIRQSANEFPFDLQESLVGIYFQEPIRVDISVIGIPTVQVGLVHQTTFSSTNLSVWKSVKTEMGVSQCGENCTLCGTCQNRYTKQNDNMMKKDGDFIISGVFHIRQSNDIGDTCGSISAKGIQLAEALFYAVDTIKSRYRGQNILPGVTVGAIVQDACQLQLSNNGYNIESCSVQNMEQSKDTQSFISYELVRHQTGQYANFQNPKQKFLLSPFGVSLDKVSLDRYVKAMSDTFQYVNWTYVHVVYSNDIHGNLDVAASLKIFQERNICIASEIVLNYNKTSVSENIEKLLKSTQETGAILLLTNSDDTNVIMNMVHQTNGSYKHLNFVVLPWDTSIKTSFVPGCLLFKPKPEIDTDFQNYLKSLMNSNKNQRNPWWVDFYENYNGCHNNIDTNMLYPISCAHTKPNMNNFSTSPIASNVIQTVDTILLNIDKLYKDLCSSQTGLCQEFLNYDVSGYIRSKLIENTSDHNADQGFTVYGDLKLPLDIVNYHLNNGLSTPISVGLYSSRDDLIVDKNAIKTYGDDNNSYIANHVCKDWCPSCYRCKSAVTKKSGFLYHTGDVIFTGIFPVHKRGTRALTCGSPELNKGSEVLTEAFLYALESSKTRYPYLLPGVKLGSLTIDSCSDSDNAVQTVLNFESCLTNFANDGNQVPASPSLVSGYITYDDPEVSTHLDRVLQHFGRMSLSFNSERNNHSLSALFYPYSKSSIISIIEFLEKMKWTYVDLVISADDEHILQKGWFMDIAQSYNICVAVTTTLQFGDETSVSMTATALSRSTTSVAVVLVSKEVAREFFGATVNRPLSKMYVLGEAIQDWQDMTGITLPVGTIVLDRSGKINTGFQTHYDETILTRQSKYGNKWFQEISTARDACSNNINCLAQSDILLDASKIILGMDIMLHALHSKYTSLCPQKQGLCQEFANIGPSLSADDFENISFVYQGEMLQLPLSENKQGSFIIKNYQKSGFVKVGEWQNGVLKFESSKIKSYDSNGNQRGSLPTSACYTNCKCSNPDMIVNLTTTSSPVPSIDHLVFYDTSQAFDNELWAIVLLTIACGGALVSLMFIVYVIIKVCAGLLQKRYIGLGIMLLLSVIALYLSVLPFVFTPSENICYLRFFLPGFTYALTYSVILSKLMSLRAYKLIGLGGELSKLNQFLTVLFVTGVQIAIGVQWWMEHGSPLVTQTASESEVTKYACDFVKKDFVIYHVYIMFLIVLCAFYAILVRKETKNMGEAKLILVTSWITIVVWAAWITVLLIQPRDFVEPTICVGIIVSASVTILVVFVPKLHRISKLKYDVKKSGTENGGYKIDPDFMFERPYTLPAMRSSFKYSEKTNPKSISKFDSSLSY